MNLLRFALLIILTMATVASSPGRGQKFQPPDAKQPDAATLEAIAAKTSKLNKVLAALRQQGLHDPWLADAEVYLHAARWIVEHKEFFHADSPAWTLETLDRGLLRASFLAAGENPWAFVTGRAVAHGYRSRIDGSVQPYAVTLPAAYGRAPNKKWRLDVVLHGRDSSLTEVKFLHTNNGDKAASLDQEFIRIDIFGRVNNAYRWAGESDVFEAIDSFINTEQALGRDRLIDRARFVLRGFSMGGAGAWHLGLHYPDRWSVLGPGAGFTTTHGYIKNLPKLPAYQEACLHIYDAVDYAANAFNVPVVAYSGDQDPQMQAAVNIETQLKKLGIPMTHLVAPGLEHKFPPEWQKKAEALYAEHVAKGRPDYPPRVNFVTYTLKYPSCFWVEILGLDRHYQKTQVDAEWFETGYKIKTANVRTLHLALPEGFSQNTAVEIDGQKLLVRPWINPAGSYHIYLTRRQDRWQAVWPQLLLTERSQKPQKVHKLQGPIDDAFTDSFLCVRGTDKPWHEATHKHAEANLERFSREWAKYLRGHVPVKDDIDVNNDDIAAKHLILFGDPASNPLIAQVLHALPLEWTREHLVFAGQKVSAADHVPVLIFLNPLNPNRYVVLNSGHTFHAADFKGTNALLYPRLGDYALLKLTSTSDPLAIEVVTAGLFDEFWTIAAK